MLKLVVDSPEYVTKEAQAWYVPHSKHSCKCRLNVSQVHRWKVRTSAIKNTSFHHVSWWWKIKDPTSSELIPVHITILMSLLTTSEPGSLRFRYNCLRKCAKISRQLAYGCWQNRMQEYLLTKSTIGANSSTDEKSQVSQITPSRPARVAQESLHLSAWTYLAKEMPEILITPQYQYTLKDNTKFNQAKFAGSPISNTLD